MKQVLTIPKMQKIDEKIQKLCYQNIYDADIQIHEEECTWKNSLNVVLKFSKNVYEFH